MTTVNHKLQTSAKLSLSAFERRSMPSKCAFLNSLSRLIRIQRQVKVSLCFMKMCTFPMEITKQGAQSLPIKMRNAEFYLKEAQLFPTQPLATRFPKLISKLERLDCFHMFNSQHKSKPSADYPQVSDDTKLLRFTLLR